jgi:NADP-dependent 3-hydroxy acid dehydrogenase YdfG
MLNDRVALLSRGGSRIGKAIGVQFAKNGSKVALASQLRRQLESVAAELTVRLEYAFATDGCPKQQEIKLDLEGCRR